MSSKWAQADAFMHCATWPQSARRPVGCMCSRRILSGAPYHLGDALACEYQEFWQCDAHRHANACPCNVTQRARRRVMVTRFWHWHQICLSELWARGFETESMSALLDPQTHLIYHTTNGLQKGFTLNQFQAAMCFVCGSRNPVCLRIKSNGSVIIQHSSVRAIYRYILLIYRHPMLCHTRLVLYITAENLSMLCTIHCPEWHVSH